MSRGRLAIHAHFHQPLRIDPFSGVVPEEPAAAPFHDWNSRIAAECYRPNAERGNLRRISFDLSPTLAGWLAEAEPVAYRGFVEAAPNALAQPYHHPILPLASALDRRTEVRWGIRDFELRFGRRPLGIWLPETAVDLPTLRLVAAEGIRFTILAPWQGTRVDGGDLDTRHPYRVDLGDGRSLIVLFYDGPLSGAVSFDPNATTDAERFAHERVAVRLASRPGDGGDPVVVVATDGELYGHHQPFRDLFLERLTDNRPDHPAWEFEIVTLPAFVAALDPAALPEARIVERTSWSCLHGVLRWSAECPDAVDGRWKAPLRAALERLATAIDVVAEGELAKLPGQPDLWAARDAYVEVVDGVVEGAAFAARWLGERATAQTRRVLLDLLEAERWRLAMFASDAWYWEDPIRFETKQALRAAARAVRLVDGVAGTRLEARLLGDLELLRSPSTGASGAELYRTALAEVGQPPPGVAASP